MFGLSVTGSTLFLWISLAIIVSPTAKEVTFEPSFSWSPVVGTAIVVACAAASVYNFVWISADNYYLRSQFADNMGGNPIELAKTAIALNPWNDMYQTQLAQAYQQQMIGWLTDANTKAQANDQTGAQASNEKARQLYALAEQSYLDVIAFVPTEYDNYVFLSALYNQGGQYFGDTTLLQKSIAIADRGIADEPFGPAIRLQKAVAYWSLNELPKTIEVLKGTVDLDPNYIEPRLLYAEAFRATGDFAAARTQYKIILQKDPTNAQALSSLQAVEASMGISPTATPQPTATPSTPTT
jgi:tetratricopeptide (TPR) repeat protein